jgi:hypothetical protein
MQEDKTLTELIDLLQTATISAEEMIQDWEGEYVSPELLATIQKAKKLLQILDENQAITEGTV